VISDKGELIIAGAQRRQCARRALVTATSSILALGVAQIEGHRSLLSTARRARGAIVLGWAATGAGADHGRKPPTPSPLWLVKGQIERRAPKTGVMCQRVDRAETPDGVARVWAEGACQIGRHSSGLRLRCFVLSLPHQQNVSPPLPSSRATAGLPSVNIFPGHNGSHL